MRERRGGDEMRERRGGDEGEEMRGRRGGREGGRRGGRGGEMGRKEKGKEKGKEEEGRLNLSTHGCSIFVKLKWPQARKQASLYTCTLKCSHTSVGLTQAHSNPTHPPPSPVGSTAPYLVVPPPPNSLEVALLPSLISHW